MTSLVWLVMLLGCLALVHTDSSESKEDTESSNLRHGGGFWPWNIPRESNANSRYCLTYENKEQTTYPNCSEPLRCNRRCRWKRTCSGWWRRSCTNKYTCNTCCLQTKLAVVSVNKTVCSDGYYGAICDKPKCSSPCTDMKTTCTARNTCGPACFPGGCKNGGTCVTGSPNNTCTCDTGYSGDHCQTRARCNNNCQNGGTCNSWSGRCYCANGFYGVFCEKVETMGCVGPTCTPACLNNGVCTAGRCVCTAGFTGSACETLDTSSP